jgi:hypothetical protein
LGVGRRFAIKQLPQDAGSGDQFLSMGFVIAFVTIGGSITIMLEIMVLVVLERV